MSIALLKRVLGNLFVGLVLLSFSIYIAIKYSTIEAIVGGVAAFAFLGYYALRIIILVKRGDYVVVQAFCQSVEPVRPILGKIYKQVEYRFVGDGEYKDVEIYLTRSKNDKLRVGSTYLLYFTKDGELSNNSLLAEERIELGNGHPSLEETNQTAGPVSKEE